MRRIRLCIVMGAHWEAQMGGAQYQARCLLERLEGYPQFEVYYLARLTPSKLERERYTIVRFGAGQRVGHAQFLPDLRSLYSTLKALRPDVVYQRGLKAYTGVCAIYCARHDARLVFHIASDRDARRQRYSSWRPSAIVQRIERRIAEYGLRRAHTIVAQTDDQARLLRAEYGLEVAAVVRNFHPPLSRAQPRTDPHILRVVWIANFKPVKNPELFVELAEAFRGRTDVEFVMAGRSGDPQRYAQLHEKIRKLDNLKYVGELAVEKVDELLAGSDILVNTSSTEGFSNTFIQAWLRSVPVVSCYVDPDRCLSQGGAGILAGSSEGLRRIIDDLARDRVRLANLRRTAFEYGHRNHALEQADGLVRLLGECGRSAGASELPEDSGGSVVSSRGAE